MLTNATVKGARPGARPFKLCDTGGLHLLVRPSGTRNWRMRYQREGREQLLTFGTYPELGLGEAREMRDTARAQLRRGEDPRLHESASPAAASVTFEICARRWHEHNRPAWSTVHAGDVLASLERDIFLAIGALELAAIGAPDIVRALRAVEQRGSIETARRLRQRISAVFGFAMSEGLCAADPAAVTVHALAGAKLRGRHPALIDIAGARALQSEVDHIAGAGNMVALASRFLALTAVRMATLRGARWDQFEQLDGSAPLWRIPPALMKLSRARKADPSAEHLVPLSAAGVDVLRAARELDGCETVFPIGEGAIGAVYARTSFAGRHVPHGWRATFSTILNEAHPREPGMRALIDQALGHVPKDKVEAAYNRAELLDARRGLFDEWGTLLTA